MRSVVLFAVFCWASSLTARAGAEWARYAADADDLVRLEKLYPAALPIFHRGEAAFRAGEVQKAASLFGEAAKLAPTCAIAARRECQALTELGKRPEAIAACDRAVAIRQSAPSSRALVGALMAGRPTPEQLARAVRLAEQARFLMPDQPWAAAAECDIARRLGEVDMREKCVAELENTAPGHYETVRAAAALTARRTPLGVLFGWIALGAVFAGTAIHALAALARRSRGLGVKAGAASAALALGMTLSMPSARAEDGTSAAHGANTSGGLSKWRIDDADPKKSLPTAAERDRDPLHFGYHLMDLGDKADAALGRGDPAGAAKFYEAMVQAVPNRAVGYRRACEMWQLAGDRERALLFCRGALASGGATVHDHARLARLLLDKKAPLTEAEQTDLSAMIEHLKGHPAGKELEFELNCELGARIGDERRLESCAGALAAKAPDDPKTLSYQWALAMQRGDIEQAARIVERARKTKMAPEGLRKMEQATEAQNTLGARLRRHLPSMLALALAAAVAIGLGLGVRGALRRRTVPHPA